MRIAVNTRFLLPDKMEGFGWFTHEVVSRIVKNHPEHEFLFFFDRKFDKKFVYANNVTPIVLPPQARHPILWKLWFNRSVTHALKKHNADVFFSPDGYLSLKTHIPQVGVIHDLNFEHYPEDLPKQTRKYYLKYFPKFAVRADRIVTVSEYSKKDIVEQYGVNADKIDVAYNGVNPIYSPSMNEEKEDYFLFVGSLHPRKNITRLLKAYDQFRKDQDSSTKLVLVGDAYWWNTEMEKAYRSMSHKADVVFMGHLQLEELAKVVASAKAMAYVSYFEGFGIPLVESMASGVPCMTSDKTSLPEVAGDAALIVDPFSVDDIAKGLHRLDSDEGLRQELIQKGLERSKLFTWDNTAERVWESISKVIAE